MAIVGRIDRTTRNASGFKKFLICKCNYCGAEFTAADGRGLRGAVEGYETMGRAAMCRECRNDSGRRMALTHGRYLGAYHFETEPRAAQDPRLAAFLAPVAKQIE